MGRWPEANKQFVIVIDIPSLISTAPLLFAAEIAEHLLLLYRKFQDSS